MNLRRRLVLVGGALAGGGALFGGVVAAFASKVEARSANALTGNPDDHGFGSWLRLSNEGLCTVFVPHIDMGQGTHTALAQIVADELDLEWAQMRVLLAPIDHAFANGALAQGWLAGDIPIPAWLQGSSGFVFKRIARLRDVQISGGSTAVRFTGQLGLRVVAASARLSLVQAAARLWGLPAEEIGTASGCVVHTPTRRSAKYADLAGDAAENGFSGHPRLKTGGFRLVGTSPPRLDIPAKLDGSLRYGTDIQLPNLRMASVTAAPVRGARLLHVDEAPALAVAGVEKVIRLPDAVAVVASGWWAASQGLGALKPSFGPVEGEGAVAVSTEALIHAQDEAMTSARRRTDRSQGDVDEAEAAALASGGLLVKAAYRVQMLHHATMEPMAMTAHWQADRLEVWAGVQDPLNARAALAKAAQLPFNAVTLHALPIGGAFGRRLPRSMEPALRQLVAVARACDHPVKLLWSREEDFTQGTYRPALGARLQAVLQPDGTPASWRHVYVRKNTESDAAHVPYNIAAQDVQWVDDPAESWNVPSGAWRAVTHVQQTWYTECFIDELAHAARQDPLGYRLNLLRPKSREALVLMKLREAAAWGQALAPGVGQGVALAHGMGSLVALCLHAQLDGQRRPQVTRAVAVVDCGLVVHPDTARQQVEGSIVMGLSAAIGEQITLRDGAVQQRNFTDYPILRLSDVPAIEVHFMGGERVLGGLGEPALPPVAPALANALFAATGQRIRQLPLSSAYAAA